jgi:hypothetical protein
LALPHIVEVKQKRLAAPMVHFPAISELNRLNHDHLTIQCQARMQANLDLLLDEVNWQEQSW